MQKKILIIALSIIAVLFVAVLLRNEFTNKSFDSAKWKNWEESEASPSERWEMINSLQENQKLIGKTKNEIIDLLGTPDKKDNVTFIYYLGYTKKGINTANLEVLFNEKDIVSNFKITNG
jgi:hypothetical protein